MRTTKNFTKLLWLVAIMTGLSLSSCSKKNDSTAAPPGGTGMPGGCVGCGVGGAGGLVAAGVGRTVNYGSGVMQADVILEFRNSAYTGTPNQGFAWQGTVDATGMMRVTQDDQYCRILRGDYGVTRVVSQGSIVTGSLPVVRNLVLEFGGPSGLIEIAFNVLYLEAKAPAIVAFNGATYPFTMGSIPSNPIGTGMVIRRVSTGGCPAGLDTFDIQKL